jgi:hypothetical protein
MRLATIKSLVILILLGRLGFITASAEDRHSGLSIDLQYRDFPSSFNCLELAGAGIYSGADAVNSSADSPQLSSSKPVSRGNAMLRSLLVPGWGESYLGYHSTARKFFWADMLIWAGVIGLETYSNWKEDQFMAYGQQHAGVQMAGKNDVFYSDIGNYMNTEEYNEEKIRDRNFDAVYTNPAYFWAWDSNQNRLTYDHTRIQSRSAHNKVIFFFGAAALNRLISFIDTGKKANDVINRQKTALDFQLGPDPSGNPDGVRLMLTATLP